MNIIFRVDASTRIGSGHVMRCMTLAAALSERGGLCHFVCREHPGNLIEQIRGSDYAVSVLPLMDASTSKATGQEHATWLGAGSEEDARQTLEALGGFTVDWMIVDHYAIGIDWERSFRGRCRRLMVIDDLADRAHECDLLLDQNLGRCEEDYRGLTPEGCRLLLGPQYALLRPEFARLRDYSLVRRDKFDLTNLMISMGGMDADNVTGKVLNILHEIVLPDDLYIRVVMGSRAPWLSDIRTIAAGHSYSCEVIVDTANMGQLMADSDLMIGAAGSTSWERCCLGLPALITALAPNQHSVVLALQREGAAVSLHLDELDRDHIGSCLSELMDKPDLMASMSLHAAAVTDGKGAGRVCQAFMGIDSSNTARTFYA